MQSSLKKYNLYNARSALKLIAEELIKKHNFLTVHLPEYICVSVIEAFVSENISIEYYKVDFVNKKANFCNSINYNDLIVCVNYYGIEFDYSYLDSLENVYKVYDSAHNYYINIDKYQNFDFIIIGIMKTIPFVSGGAFLYSKLIFQKTLKRNSLCTSFNEIPNFIYDIFLYYIYNKNVSSKKRRIHIVLSFPFQLFIRLFCKNKDSEIRKMSLLSKVLFTISKKFQQYYCSRYKEISKYLVNENTMRTFVIIKGNNIESLKTENINLLNNWIDEQKYDIDYSKEMGFFDKSLILKISPFMDYKKIYQIINKYNLEIL